MQFIEWFKVIPTLLRPLVRGQCCIPWLITSADCALHHLLRALHPIAAVPPFPLNFLFYLVCARFGHDAAGERVSRYDLRPPRGRTVAAAMHAATTTTTTALLLIVALVSTQPTASVAAGNFRKAGGCSKFTAAKLCKANKAELGCQWNRKKGICLTPVSTEAKACADLNKNQCKKSDSCTYSKKTCKDTVPQTCADQTKKGLCNKKEGCSWSRGACQTSAPAPTPAPTLPATTTTTAEPVVTLPPAFVLVGNGGCRDANDTNRLSIQRLPLSMVSKIHRCMHLPLLSAPLLSLHLFFSSPLSGLNLPTILLRLWLLLSLRPSPALCHNVGSVLERKLDNRNRCMRRTCAFKFRSVFLIFFFFFFSRFFNRRQRLNRAAFNAWQLARSARGLNGLFSTVLSSTTRRAAQPARAPLQSPLQQLVGPLWRHAATKLTWTLPSHASCSVRFDARGLSIPRCTQLCVRARGSRACAVDRRRGGRMCVRAREWMRERRGEGGRGERREEEEARILFFTGSFTSARDCATDIQSIVPAKSTRCIRSMWYQELGRSLIRRTKTGRKTLT